jgi:hypothetical protein
MRREPFRILPIVLGVVLAALGPTPSRVLAEGGHLHVEIVGVTPRPLPRPRVTPAPMASCTGTSFGVADPHAFRTLEELDNLPEIATDPDVDGVWCTADRSESGAIDVVTLIGSKGQVRSVGIRKGLPGGLNERAIERLYAMRFAPAVADGRRVSAWVDIKVTYCR